MSKVFNRETATVKEGHTSFETGLESEYPWGFKQTERRTWIESKTIKKTGEIQMRVVHCMKNPKNGIWAKPKAGTYNAICILLQDEAGFITYDALYSIIYSKEENLKFIDQYSEFITVETLERLKNICGRM